MDKRLLVLALGMFALGTDSFVVAGILPDVGKSLDVKVTVAGQLVTVYALSYAVLTPVMATLTAHWPRKSVLVSALAIFVIGNVLTATLPTFETVLASRIIAGLGAAMFSPAASAMAASLVPPERRARALAVVLAGLSGATALGAPIGTLVGSLADWRMTMWLVTTLGALAVAGVVALLPHVPAQAPLRLRDRLAPLADARVAATLATTLLVLSGLYLVYTYISLAFDRATGNDGRVLAVLLAIWGIASTVGNLGAGSLTDRFGNRKIVNLAIIVVALDFFLMPWSSATFSGAIIALTIWGLCGWGMIVPQQHRLVGIAPALAPILLALNSATIYVAVSVSAAAGALALGFVDPHYLPLVGTILIVAGLVAAESAHRLIKNCEKAPAPQPATVNAASTLEFGRMRGK